MLICKEPMAENSPHKTVQFNNILMQLWLSAACRVVTTQAEVGYQVTAVNQLVLWLL